MRYVSTRDQTLDYTLSQALVAGLAPDGGLFVPGKLPRFDLDDFEGLQGEEKLTDVGAAVLRPFFEGDVLEPNLDDIVREAFDFQAPLDDLPDGTAVLELFHGPSAAFKDFGAKFLASSLSRLNEGEEQPLTILVATSGDTGGAVAAAFHGLPNVEVVVLYPKGKVSERQEKQLTCWTGNVKSFAVRGVFDDCQRMVKAAFADPWFAENLRISSANSINIGRLLPQSTYYARASLAYLDRHGREPGFVVPTGNVGNALAAVWAKEMGFPVREVVLATNANRPIPDFLETGTWEPHDTKSTLATAMDVGNPSNMERLRYLYPEVTQVKRAGIRADSVDDETISKTIEQGESKWGRIWCPHTACAVAVRERIGGDDWIVVSTAHPAKFETIVEPLVGHPVDIPPALAELLDRETHVTEIDADLDVLKRLL